jgi:hypothetical protein
MARYKKHLYSLYTNREDPDSPIEVIATGASFWAFLFHGFWLLYHRAYYVGILWLILFGGMAGAGQYFAIHPNYIAAIQLGLQIWIGLEGSYLREWNAKRRGLRFEGSYMTHDAEEAELRYYDADPQFNQMP